MILGRFEKSFKLVYGPLAKAVGDCFLTLENDKDQVDATAVISAIIAVAIDLAAKTNSLAKKELVDLNHLARFVAITLTNTLAFSPEIKHALDNVALAGLPPPTDKSN